MKRTYTFLLFLIIQFFIGCGTIKEYQRVITSIEIEDIDLSRVADGEYRGECDAVIVKATVLVKVKDHRITEIQLVEHKHGRGEKAEVLPEKVVASQSLKVDTITGATSSSKAILKAVEQALLKGIG